MSKNSSILGNQKLKLGIFGVNCSGGLVMSKADTSFEVTWEHNRKVVQKADHAGFEIALPIGRWKGFGGETNFGGTSFETYTWAAGMAAETKNINVVATSHVTTVHPVFAAKAAATIDAISGGRFGLNLVMGWSSPEQRMLGDAAREHDAVYRYGSEWINIVKGLWENDVPFDFEGEFFNLVGLESMPKPLQKRPLLINAGSSPVALEFAAREVDLMFVNVQSEGAVEKVLRVKRRAQEEFQRDLGLASFALLICRDTEEEAKATFNNILENGDWEGAANMCRLRGLDPAKSRDRMEKYVAGYGSQQLVGTPEQIVEELKGMSEAGLDAMVFGFLDYFEELDFFEQKVMPLMKQAGLRC